MSGMNLLKSFGLIVLLWNCRSIVSNSVEFNNFVYSYSPHVICLCETFLKPGINYKLKGYKIFRRDRTGRAGGLLILVKDSINSRELRNFREFRDGNLEAMAVQIEVNSHWCDICLLYNPGGTSVSQCEFDYYFGLLSLNSVICGDFNAHNLLWSQGHGRRFINSNVTGNSLVAALNDSDGYNLLTPCGFPTHFDKLHGRNSTIDLMFGRGIFGLVDYVKHTDLIGSDHYPNIYCFSCRPDAVIASSPLSWSLGNLNWNGWRNCLTQRLSGLESYTYDTISEAIAESTKVFTDLKSRKVVPRKCRPFWDEKCSYYVALRRRAQKRYERFPTDENKTALNRQTAIGRRYMLSQKRGKWQEFCSSLDHSTPDSKVWSLFRQLQGKPVFSFEYPIVHNNNIVEDKTVVANLFADFYSKTFNRFIAIPNLGLKEQAIQVGIQLNNKDLYNSDFNLHELNLAIDSLNRKSAMGSDYMHNEFFVNFPKLLLSKLLQSINEIWRSGLIPDGFKLSTLIPILKPGKCTEVVESYRPIALLSCFGKLMEKMVHKRLYSFIENRNLIPPFQSGFRSQRSCTDTLVYLEHHIQLALRTQKVLIIVFFDIEKAFDSASHVEILYNLHLRGVNGRMLKWFCDYFLGRRFRVRVGNSFSDEHDVKCGVPQGSILSPLLFILLLCNFPSMQDVHTLLYADDLSLFVVESSIDIAVAKIQRAINAVNSWLISIGLKISHQKSNFMVFTRKRLTVVPSVFLGNQRIEMVTVLKFLGIYFDAPFLTWRNHVNFLRESCNKKLNIMRCLASTKWGANRSVLIQFYRAFV